MAMITCKTCGGNLILIPGQSVAECDSCGTLQTVPSADSEKKLNLFTRANQLRASCDFDKAAGVYESIVAEFPKEAEAYWGLILCKYGIEYVDDYATGKKIPTCHRSSFDSILTDPDYVHALNHADVLAERVYREDAQQLEKIRLGIVEVSNREEPYDIFICYKETDPSGRRTLDSVIAQDIYGLLTEKGYRVFFSRVTLRDKLGLEYEPYIFAALNSAKVMLAIGTNVDYYNAVWVRNEWSRYLKLMGKDRSKRLFPVYKGIGPYELPQEMQRLQALNYGELGADQDLLMGIEKVIPKAKPAPIYAHQPVPVYAPQPAPAPVGGQAEQEAVALIKKGMKINAIKVIREAYGLSLKEAKDWADAAEQGNVRPLGNASVPAPTTASAPSKTPTTIEELNLTVRTYNCLKRVNVHSVADLTEMTDGDILRIHNMDQNGLNEIKTQLGKWGYTTAPAPAVPAIAPAPQGIDEIAACIRNKQPQQGAELARKYYNLLPDQAENVYKKIEFALLHDQYPAPDAPLRGEKATEIWTEVTKSFLEMQKAVRAVNKHEHSCTEEVNRYNRATTQKDRDYRSGLVDYDKKQIAYEVGRIQYWGKRMDDAVKKLQAEMELLKPKPAAAAPSRLRFDGIYQCKDGQYNSCLRFFSDGVVVSVTTSGTAQQIESWFNHDYENTGKYAVSGAHISFSCTSLAGTVDYRGILTKDAMDLEIHSHINGYQSKRSYSFIPFVQNRQPAPTPAASAYQAPQKQIPKGINDIAALLRANQQQEAIQLTGECYDLMGSKAADACRRIDMALRYERYPRPEVPLAGERLERAWESASKAFREMRGVVLEVQKNEAKVAEMVRAYNMATSDVKRNDYSSKIEYYASQVRYYFGRIGRWASDMEQAEVILMPAIEERKKAIESIQAFKKMEAERGYGRVFLVVEGNGKQLPANKGLRYFFIVDGNMHKQILLMADAKTVATSLDLPAGPHTVALQVYGMAPSDLRAEVAPHQIQVTPSGVARVIANRPGLFGKQTLRIEYQG